MKKALGVIGGLVAIGGCIGLFYKCVEDNKPYELTLDNDQYRDYFISTLQNDPLSLLDSPEGMFSDYWIDKLVVIRQFAAREYMDDFISLINKTYDIHKDRIDELDEKTPSDKLAHMFTKYNNVDKFIQPLEKVVYGQVFLNTLYKRLGEE